MKIKVKGLSSKKLAGGRIAYYWQPNPDERKAKWTGLPLGDDITAAVAKAEKRNAEIEEWRCGGAKPRAVNRFVKRNTLGDLIRQYRGYMAGVGRERGAMSSNTIRTADTPLKRLETWAGDKPLAFITRARVRALRTKMMEEGTDGFLGHHAAFAVLSKGRELFAYAADTLDLLPADANPFLRFGLGKPAPRQKFWQHHHIAPMLDASTKLEMPSIGLALELALYIGQREADVLKASIGAWREIPKAKFRMDPDIYDLLANDDGPDAGKVMGIYVQQGKTKRWIGIPIEGDMRRRIEAAIKASKDAGATTILLCERTKLPWGQDDFIHRFGDVRAKAAATARKAGDEELAGEIAELWFGDTRRSCVVVLGELGLDDAAIAAITGHKLATIKNILETYMPRTEAMAGRAVAARITSLAEARERKEQQQR